MLKKSNLEFPSLLVYFSLKQVSLFDLDLFHGRISYIWPTFVKHIMKGMIVCLTESSVALNVTSMKNIYV